MKILITGGAGVFGRALITHLAHAGYHDLVSLDIAPLPRTLTTKAQDLHGDIRDRKAVRAAIKGADIVIHSAAALPSYTPKEIHSIDVDGTRILLEEARAGSVARFIHISTGAVYGIPARLPSIEGDERLAYDPYNTAKIEAELACEEHRGFGMPVTILRPKSFLGPGRLGLFGILFEWANEGHHFPVIGSGLVPYQFLHVNDLCVATAIALHHSAANDDFNIATPNYTTIREDFQAVLEAAGHGKRIISLPLKPATLALQTLEKLHLSPVYRRLYLRLVSGSYVDTQKARDVLGFSARYSNKEALVETYKWYAANRLELNQKVGVNHTSLWRQGALRLGKAVF